MITKGVGLALRIFDRLILGPAPQPYEPHFSDFIHYDSEAGVEVDFGGWWRTEAGKRDREEQLRKLK